MSHTTFRKAAILLGLRALAAAGSGCGAVETPAQEGPPSLTIASNPAAPEPDPEPVALTEGLDASVVCLEDGQIMARVTARRDFGVAPGDVVPPTSATMRLWIDDREATISLDLADVVIVDGVPGAPEPTGYYRHGLRGFLPADAAVACADLPDADLEAHVRFGELETTCTLSGAALVVVSDAVCAP
jgi:hypothetical protein